MELMRAVSLWQPHASLWASGRKKIETRSWSTHVTGPVLVHAAMTDKGMRDALRYAPELCEICTDQFGKNWGNVMPRGALIGVVLLSASNPTDAISIAHLPGEGHMGNFGPGRYGWYAEKAALFKEHVPYKGSQGFFNVPGGLVSGEVDRIMRRW